MLLCGLEFCGFGCFGGFLMRLNLRIGFIGFCLGFVVGLLTLGLCLRWFGSFCWFWCF